MNRSAVKKVISGVRGGSGCARVGLFCPFWLFLGLIRHLEPILGLAWASLTLISIIAHSLGPLGGTGGVKKKILSIFWNYMKWRENITNIFLDPPSPSKWPFLEPNFELWQSFSAPFRGQLKKKTRGNSSVSHRLSKNAKK